MINFGTDGWRAVLGEEFNDCNVKKVILAIGKYIFENYGYEKHILVGYDPRKKADYYANLSAEILSAKGFTVLLSSAVVPTPILAYNAKYRNACAIMFTASHNPPEYLGIKFIPDYAGPATSDITDGIMSNLDCNLPNADIKGEVKLQDFAPVYYEHIEKIIDFEKIKKLKSKILLDGLYSASIGYIDTLLKKHNIEYDSMHMVHDVNFGGLMPDPKPKYLGDLIREIKSGTNTIGLANDGDADRFGIIDENGEYVSPDIIISILLQYLVKKGYTGSLVKTVGSSIFTEKFAEKLGINVIETAVGFKHVGEAMRNNKVIIGGEESGGLSIYGHIPEKDGILANLLLLEALSDSGITLVELCNRVIDIVGIRFYTDRLDLKTDSSDSMTNVIEKFKTIKTLGDFVITDISTKDGVKLMIGDRAKILVRPSGTEPLLRIYFEADDNNKLQKMKNLVQIFIKEKA